MLKDWSEFARERKESWTPAQWAVYNVASVAFTAEADRLSQDAATGQVEGNH